MSRTHSYCFTINNYTDDDVAQVMSLWEEHGCDYYVIGFEVGEKGTPHIQGYVHFPNALTRSSLSKKISRANIRKAKGNAEQNYKYCTKDGDYYVEGAMPEQGKAGKDLIDNIMQNPYENFHLYNQYRKSYRELQLSQKKNHERRLMTLAYIERFPLMDECKDCLYIPGDKYDLYNGEQVVILEYDCSIRDEVVRWIHGHPPTIKRGYELIKFDPEIIYILYSTPHEHVTLLKQYYKLISN